MTFPVTWLDVFTSQPLAGNALAVVHDADALDDAAMLAIARETRLSETAFVQTAGAAGADYRLRIFTMMEELPFAGHPSLGTAVAVAHSRGEQRASYVQQTRAGLQPIDVELDGLRAHASMLQGPAQLSDVLAAQEVLGALGLDVADAHPELPAQVISTGTPHVALPLASAAPLARIRPDPARAQALLAATGAVVIYAVAIDPVAGTARARGFFESPGGLIEDPATGSAAGPLCAYAARHLGCTALEIEQGVEMGRPSRLITEMAREHVRVAGDAVVTLDARLHL